MEGRWKKKKRVGALTRTFPRRVHSVVKKYRARCHIYGRRTLNAPATSFFPGFFLIAQSRYFVVEVLLLPLLPKTTTPHQR